MSTVLRLAVQKKGRLSESSLSLLKECGVKFSNNDRKLKATSTNFPIEFLFLRDDDIPDYVSSGVADIGIVGENEVAEKKKNVDLIKRLGFSKCRISLAIPKEVDYEGLKYFQGKKVATSYPVILRQFFEEQGVDTDIHTISGSVEIAPGIGLADGIFDIVSSGSTLISNGLKEVEKVFFSEAVLVANPGLDADKRAILDRLLFRIAAVQEARNFRYIMLNAPEEALKNIEEILPGAKSPTVTPLSTPGWVSLQAIIQEDEFWSVIEDIKSVGGEDIISLPIDKMIK
ncbi:MULTISPECIES: ATP phosphoribosyltransferase [Persicobacter]|uniref:ATP phosphoribosyltransferase n=1 Tax=Persicobacter diffluens TaxID=981 RepID=A0AAN4VXD4_9BACT|nr:ATP phosphoribosyltransferase [Persicobacter sp. CCB-QB2]GJM61761.1 ATP phosphoribosyltransferase [Persicobacter diffluens]